MTNEELIEAMARAIFKHDNEYCEDAVFEEGANEELYCGFAAAALAVAAPVIRARALEEAVSKPLAVMHADGMRLALAHCAPQTNEAWTRTELRTGELIARRIEVAANHKEASTIRALTEEQNT